MTRFSVSVLGDSLAYHNGELFSTRDRDHDEKGTEHCAQILEGAWWFIGCEHSSLNGPYFQTEIVDPTRYHGVR